MNELPAPTLSPDRVQGVASALRPCRRSGPRVELDPHAERAIIHNYGHGGAGVTLSWGTAVATADIIDRQPRANVAVLGAGVIGLTAAAELQARGYRVTIYAERVPPRTTSNVAGALWAPTGTDWGDSPEAKDAFASWLRTSWQRFNELDAKQWGIHRLPVYETGRDVEDPRFFTSRTLQIEAEFERIPIAGLNIPGRRYRSLLIQTPHFLEQLTRQLIDRGAELTVRTLHSRDDIEALEQPLIVNCLGLSSGALFDDPRVFAARGQVLHLDPEPLGYILHHGYTYMFPRPDVLILGGTFEENVEHSSADEDIVPRILNAHRKLFGLDPIEAATA